MADVLTELAAKLNHKLALIDDRPGGLIVKWTYAELEANANRLARLLIALGVQPKDRIVSCGQNSCWLVAMTNAVRKIGAVGVPLNYRLTPDEATYVVDNSDAVVVFSGSSGNVGSRPSLRPSWRLRSWPKSLFPCPWGG